MPNKTKEQLKEELGKLKEEFEQYKKESILWSIEDFLDNSVWGYTISPEQAQDALEAMIRRHDADIGINWATVYMYTQDYGTKID